MDLVGGVDALVFGAELLISIYKQSVQVVSHFIQVVGDDLDLRINEVSTYRCDIVVKLGGI